MNGEISNVAAYSKIVASAIGYKYFNEVRNSKNGVGYVLEVNNNIQHFKKTLTQCVKWFCINNHFCQMKIMLGDRNCMIHAT